MEKEHSLQIARDANSPVAPQRIVVVGGPGAGKTTLARTLAERLDVPHVELDALHWQPNWTPAAIDEFRRRVTAALRGERWVVDGNYSKVRPIVWRRADTLVWLDYPLPLILWRLGRRSVRRVVRQEALWNENRETWRSLLFARDSLFWWAVKTHYRRRRETPQLLQQPEYAHLTAVRLRSPAATARWLERVAG